MTSPNPLLNTLVSVPTALFPGRAKDHKPFEVHYLVVVYQGGRDSITCVNMLMSHV